MKTRLILFSLVFLISAISCNKKDSTNSFDINQKETCDLIAFKKSTISSILNNKEIFKYLHLDNYNKNGLVLYEYPFFENLDLRFHDKKILFTRENDHENIIKLDIKENNCNSEKIPFDIYIKKENVTFKGYLNNNKEKSVIIENELFIRKVEFD